MCIRDSCESDSPLLLIHRAAFWFSFCESDSVLYNHWVAPTECTNFNDLSYSFQFMAVPSVFWKFAAFRWPVCIGSRSRVSQLPNVHQRQNRNPLTTLHLDNRKRCESNGTGMVGLLESQRVTTSYRSHMPALSKHSNQPTARSQTCCRP